MWLSGWGGAKPPAPAQVVWPPRGEGLLMWLHAPRAEAARGFLPLIRALSDRTEADLFVVTCPDPLSLEGALCLAPPAANASAWRDFLDHFNPQLCLWAEGDLDPHAMAQIQRRQLPLMVVDGLAAQAQVRSWWPKFNWLRSSPVVTAMVQTDAARRSYLAAGVAAERIEVAEPLEEPSYALPVNEAERAALAKAIGTRPVWLVVGLPAAEVDLVARAHLEALRLTHRLLLIVVPGKDCSPHRLRTCLMDEHGLEVAARAQDDELDEDVQVYLVDAEELGLWYWLAPVTYFGGTLLGGGAARSPFEAAALGSAVLHGAEVAPWQSQFERLQAAGGSRVMTRTARLGEAVGELLAADRAAWLALAGWGVVVQGGGTTVAVAQKAAALLEGKTS